LPHSLTKEEENEQLINGKLGKNPLPTRPTKHNKPNGPLPNPKPTTQTNNLSQTHLRQASHLRRGSRPNSNQEGKQEDLKISNKQPHVLSLPTYH
jgi:hypothetical protein